MQRVYVIKKPEYNTVIEKEMPGLNQAIRKYNDKIIEERTIRKHRAYNRRANNRWIKEHKEEHEASLEAFAKIRKKNAIEEYCENFQKMLDVRKKRR